jgi:lysophospholipase L1-like esterase
VLAPVLAAVALTASLTGCQPDVPSVVVVGDSISNGSRAQIEAVFHGIAGWNVGVHAIGGRSVGTMLNDMRQIAEYRPDVVVVELGTNDMGGVASNPTPPKPTFDQALQTYAEEVARIDSAMDILDEIPCVVWVNINTWTNVPLYHDPDGSGPDPRVHTGNFDLRTWGPPYNGQLEDRVGDLPRGHVTDFSGEITAMGLPWLLQNFETTFVIHPLTTTGKQKVALIMAEGVKDACGI